MCAGVGKIIRIFTQVGYFISPICVADFFHIRHKICMFLFAFFSLFFSFVLRIYFAKNV